ncbi:unnamed protein product [Rotaria sordida]|uniref:Ubiquitin-like domain-containing protein n=1 Tax=Rotaria sordida TaxID=392033 RepID=A0A815LI34_9BILA|nr:unnamed protein product [Rotaria sordida]
MASSSESIKLIIRTTNNKYADFVLEISPLLTVLDLKQKITLNHPTKPIPKDQRLIFSGKLLDDTGVLNQIFIKSTSGSSFMVHLVLDSDKNASTPRIQQPTTVQTPSIVTEQQQQQQSSSSEKLITSPHSNTYEQYLEELYRYQQQLQQFISNPNANPPICNYESQAYLQYCYTHYQMYQNLVAYQRTVIPSSTITTTSTQQSTSTDTNTTPPPAAAQQPAAGNNNNNNNNNNNDLEQENDLLGVLNMLVELFVLCSIIYFYSTFSRFLVVFVIFVLLYLHCRGYLSIHRRRRAVQVPPAPIVPEQAAAAAVPAAAGNDGEQGGEDEVEPEVVANEAQNQNDIEHQRPSPPPPGPVGENQITTSRLLFTAISTFFSSLIPERPQRA